jgi:hypothetical protein
VPLPIFRKLDRKLIELHWGHPTSLHLPDGSEAVRISTLEQARHWLKRKWPVADRARDFALAQLEAAMDCLVSVTSARAAFLAAADTAGFSLLPATRAA